MKIIKEIIKTEIRKQLNEIKVNNPSVIEFPITINNKEEFIKIVTKLKEFEYKEIIYKGMKGKYIEKEIKNFRLPFDYFPFYIIKPKMINIPKRFMYAWSLTS